jgi:hypothetical protein
VPFLDILHPFSKIPHYIMVTDIPLPNLTENSKNPNSYGVSGGPIMIAFTLRTSTSRQATARAECRGSVSEDVQDSGGTLVSQCPTRTAEFKLRESKVDRLLQGILTEIRRLLNVRQLLEHCMSALRPHYGLAPDVPL